MPDGDWGHRDDAPLAELRPVRNQLLEALGLPLPKLKTRGKTAPKIGPQTTELSSYRGMPVCMHPGVGGVGGGCVGRQSLWGRDIVGNGGVS